jgi:hypothetical protein
MRANVLADLTAATIRTLHAPMALKVAALETTGGELVAAVGDVRARLAVLEDRQPLPGPAGPAGPPGRDGRDGVDGKAYDVGDLVTSGGSAWYCGRSTTSAPGTSGDWQLMVKHGRDARGAR